jgi:hypothetical protein
MRFLCLCCTVLLRPPRLWVEINLSNQQCTSLRLQIFLRLLLGDLSKRISTLVHCSLRMSGCGYPPPVQFMHLKALMIARLVKARQRASAFQTPATDDRV